jgi:hypothetical protein
MSREDFVAVGLRLFAVYLLFLLIRALPTAVYTAKAGAQAGVLWWVLASALVCLGLVAVLLVFPLTLARKLLPVMRDTAAQTALGAELAWTIGITLIGLWFLAEAVTSLAYWGTWYLRTLAIVDDYDVRPEEAAGLVSTGVQLVVALVLLLGANGIRSLIHRMRYSESLP